jgi:hypothetical protein
VPIGLCVPVPVGVGMIVPPCPIRRLVALIQFVEVFVPPVVLLGPPSVGAIFALVPLVIVVVFAVTISSGGSPATLAALISLGSLTFLAGLSTLGTLGSLRLRLLLLRRSAFFSTLRCPGSVALLSGLIFLCSLVLSWSALMILRGTLILCD